MFACDKTFDPKVVLGHCDLFLQFSVLPYISALIWYMHIHFLECLCMTRSLTGHCDLISWISDFALYLDTQLVYYHTSFRL